MAFDQTTRNRLARFVSDARALLAEEFTRQLQHEYGLDPVSGEITALEKLTALDDARRETARILRETMAYYLTPGQKNGDVLERILREQAFTVLNRLCALRMAEARGLILEAVAQGYRSKGFQLYARLAGSALGETGEAYRSYLFSLFDELALELPPLFDRFSPQGRLFPRESALLRLLDLINALDLEALWVEDETIGWIYQYFNSKEERQAMRAESSAPRNSRELAVRNQFFTPRYVVEFLTDNTLGRIWYEMTQGETGLKETCRYLVRRPREVFLGSAPVSYEDNPAWVRVVMEQGDFSTLPEHPALDEIGSLALLIEGYSVAERYGYGDVLEFGSRWMEGYLERGEPFLKDALELWLILFAYQRGYLRNGAYGSEENGPFLQGIRKVYEVLRDALQNPPHDISQEELLRQPVFIPRRPLKDPRDILMLDPACGSMHFGLYAYDLYENIYAEAWEIEEQGGTDKFLRSPGLRPLHETYPDKAAFLRDAPRLIIEHNIHGIDIDPRAVQIAGLSLWLRAQKNWQVQGLKPGQRPQIRKFNIVCAEPMPGDRQMLEEFLAELRAEKLEGLMRRALDIPAGQKLRATPAMAEALAKLVRTVWQEMALAGEAGSLLKIEETLRDAIITARKQSEEKAPLFRVLEFGLDKHPREQYVQVLASDEQDFWDQAEGLVLAALQEYTEQASNDTSFRRWLFAGDATQGFVFIDVCRKRYDVVLMNPPFGQFSKRFQDYAKQEFPLSKVDIYAAFIERGVRSCAEGGFLGAITNRTFLTLSSYQSFRETFLKNMAPAQVIADLGSGVLDSALVETCAYVLRRNSSSTVDCVFIPAHSSEFDKPETLITRRDWRTRNLKDFDVLPTRPFAYWLPDTLIEIYRTSQSLEETVMSARAGLQTSDDYRFCRLWWEVNPNSREWIPFAKGGAHSPFWDDIHLVINWSNNGEVIKAFQTDALGYSESRLIRSEDDYFKPGLHYPWRTSLGFSPRILPEGCIFAAQGSAILPKEDDDNWKFTSLLALSCLNSKLYQLFMSIGVGAVEGAARSYQVGQVQRLPWPDFLNTKLTEITELVRLAHEAYFERRFIDTQDETTRSFICTTLYAENTHHQTIQNSIMDQVDEILGSLLRVRSDETSSYIEQQRVVDEDLEIQFNQSEALRVTSGNSAQDYYANIISFGVGEIIGRWDIRYATGEKPAPELPDPFAPLLACPPGMLQNTQGLPAATQDIPADYPLRITWGGILIDDPGHPEDMTGRAREALQVIWNERAEAIEQESCQILGVRSLDEYFRKPGLFFADHLKRYSKSRRQAPIYWPLATPSDSYTLWLYYHRLSDQTLFTCVNDFVDPKLKQVGDDLARLRRKNGRSAADEKELERLSDLERELKDYRAELLRVAAFWKPDLNDGVEITAAPLWKLFQHKPWQKRLRETWGKLEGGEYDWAHLAYSIWPERVREKCKTDKSLAIAHHLEHLYVQPKAPAKKRKKGQSAASEQEEMFDED